MRAEHASLEIGKQAVPNKPPPRGVSGGGDDSCQWANDRECDDPDIGTGACRMGTDVSDCRAMRAGDDDSCRWARDGECDDPNFGTGACVQGTDRTDCGQVSWLRNLNDSCATSFNNVCEEPGRGSGCAARTDRSDCRGRQRPMTINDHFFGRDDRVRVNAQELPWRYMGQYTNGAGERCTATLIARDVIVTAAHCINTDEGIRADGTFQPEAGGPAARTTDYFLNPRFNYERFNTTDEIDGLDWSLLRIDQPLGERWGFAGTRIITAQGTAAARAFDLYQAGYSWDTGDRLSANIACHIVQVQGPDNTFAHECDTTRGDSGSAFLVRNGNAWDVIGVDSNFRNNPGGPFIYIAVSAASFQPYVADFVARRIGTPVGQQTGIKPKRDR
ncbi:putative protease ydgD [alpha proteobacterium U9-1i]|nr:putative protease ydgD [alpha proteobacterium U9-1i]